MKKVLILLLVVIMLMVVFSTVALAASAVTPSIETGDISGIVDVIKDYLPLLAVLLFLLGQALKAKPNFKTWTLPFIMGGIGLAFGLALGILGGYDPIKFFLAIIEGVVVGLASTGIFEAKKQGATVQTPDEAHDIPEDSSNE